MMEHKLFPGFNLRVVPGIYYVTLRYRNNLQQQIELMILPPGINLLNYTNARWNGRIIAWRGTKLYLT